MADTLGSITVPEITPSGTFPLISDFTHKVIIAPQIISHVLGSGNHKIIQRFYRGNGARRFNFVREALTNPERILLRNFWENNSGGYGVFTYNVPNPDGTTTATLVRFENEIWSWNAISNVEFGIQLTMVEVVTSTQVCTLNATLERFPDASLSTAYTAQVQEIIPLVKLKSNDAAYPEMFISNRRCQIGSQLYQARLLKVPSVSQEAGNSSDSVQLSLGDADKVITGISKATNIDLMYMEFSLFHVASGIKLDLWAGRLSDWNGNEGPEFTMQFSDGLHDLTLPFPPRRFAPYCWKDFKGPNCPAASAGGTNLGTPCDKGYDTPAGCAFHNMTDYFGGINARPQGVNIKDNNTGVFGYGRSRVTSVSLVSNTVYDQVVPMIYTDVPMPVNLKLIAVRDEGEFLIGLGVVGEGPITSYGELSRTVGVTVQKVQHSLDGVYWHGYPKNRMGLRESYGHDPVQDNDPDRDSNKFSLGQGGDGPQTYGPDKAAGTAFIELRRVDEKGIQLIPLDGHNGQAIVTGGLQGFVWSAPGARTEGLLYNPAWIAIDILLRVKGAKKLSATDQEKLFDVQAAIDFAAICELSVTKLIGSGSENQFKYVGYMQESKAARDWITEVLMNACGGFCFRFGKLYLYGRFNSSSVQSYTVGNMIYGSLQQSNRNPTFNHLTANFANIELEFGNDSVPLYDIDHAKLIGGETSPLFLKGNISLPGTYTKSQAARILVARLREELGGATQTEIRDARKISFRTTILGLASQVGLVQSVTHPFLPNGAAEMRVESWKFNGEDFSVEMNGPTSTDSMYNMTMGYKPADVVADPIPIENEFQPDGWDYRVSSNGNGKLTFSDFSCAVNPNTVNQGFFDIYYVDESSAPYSGIASDVTDIATTINFFGPAPAEGSIVAIDAELILVKSVTGLVATVERAQFGTTATAHLRVSSTASSVNAAWKAEFNAGTGKLFRPGNQVVAPDGNQSRICEYNSGSGLMRTLLPISTLDNAQVIYSDPRIWILSVANVRIPFPPRFFKSDSRLDFKYEVDFPYAGIALIDSTLQNSAGLASPVLRKTFLNTFPHRLRTLGTTELQFRVPSIPPGLSESPCTPLPLPESQPIARAYAEISNADTYSTPRSLANVNKGYFDSGGYIDFSGGTLDTKAIVKVSLRGTHNIDFPTWRADAHNDIATMADVATKLATWLNDLPQFSSSYQAFPDGAFVRIIDLQGGGGDLTAETDSVGYLASFSGMISQLGVLSGRKYACSFSDGSFRTPLSLASPSTGPTGGATQINIGDVPIPQDARVSSVDIYATLDGQDGPFHFVGSVAPGTEEFSDSVSESSLSGAAVFPGESQPVISGEVKVTVKQNNYPLLELMVPVGKGRSNVADGLALTPLAAGSVFTIDVENSSDDNVALSVIIT